MSTFGVRSSALPMATACRSLSDSDPAGADRSASGQSPSSSVSTALARSRRSPEESPRVRRSIPSAPSQRLSSTGWPGTDWTSWNTVATPAAAAARGPPFR